MARFSSATIRDSSLHAFSRITMTHSEGEDVDLGDLSRCVVVGSATIFVFYHDFSWSNDKDFWGPKYEWCIHSRSSGSNVG